MKFTSVFTAVLALHLVVIAVLLVQPGCSSREKQRSERPSEVLGDGGTDYAATEPADHDAGIHSDFNSGAPAPAGQQGRPALQPPSRPSWTLFEESETVVETAPTASVEVLEPVRPQSPAMATYTVRKGDSLWKISNDRGVSLDALLEANNMSRESVLRIGQELRIPGEGATLPAAPAEEGNAARDSTVDTETVSHTVRSGNTLSGLARQYGTSVQAIQAANNLRNSTIRVGQVLVIPSSREASAAPSSPAKPPRDGASDSAQSYTVRSGDTLDAISRRFGVPVAELMRDNSIADARRLRVGQELRIRGAAVAPQDQPAKPAEPGSSAPATTTTARPTVPEPSAQAPAFEEVEVETITVDPLDMLDDVPVIEAEESN